MYTCVQNDRVMRLAMFHQRRSVRLEILGTVWKMSNTFRGILVVGCFPYITSRHSLLPTRTCNIPPFVYWPNGFHPKGDDTTCRI